MEATGITISLNAAAELPHEIQLLPAGKLISGRDGRCWRSPGAAVLVAEYKRRGLHLPIDINHSTEIAARAGQASPAVGWVSALSDLDGALWGQVEWLDAGRDAIQQRQYRYLSPVLALDSDGAIIGLRSVALTNQPNLEIPALNQGELMEKEVLAAVGLGESASTEQVLMAITSLRTAANSQIDLSAYAPRADLQQMEQRALTAEQALKTLQAEQSKIAAVAAVEKAMAEGKIAPASKDEYLALCTQEGGLASFEKIMSATPPLRLEQEQVNGKPPHGATVLNAEEAAVRRAAGYTEAEWLKLKEAAL